MNDQATDLLMRLLGAVGPSGDEASALRVWREAASPLADEVYTDINGNTFAILAGGTPRVLLTAHIDEIGVMVSHVDDKGFLWFSTIGGWDTQVFVGQRVRLLGRRGEIVGIIGKNPVHVMKPEDRGHASKTDDLWIDIGATSREEALEQVRIGCSGVLEAPPLTLAHGRVVSKAIDNRLSAFTLLEVLRLLGEERPAATVAAVATSQEEITMSGATTAAYAFKPDVSLVIDVTYATDHPHSNIHRDGDVRLGGGPVLQRGSANHPVVYDMLLDIAEREGIPYAVQIGPRYTGTEADKIFSSRAGVATASICMPCRYLHTPNEMASLADVEYTARLIAAFVRSISAETSFIPG